MNKTDNRFFQIIEEWFAGLPDKSEKGLRNYLQGEYPADSETSITQKISNDRALLIYNYDLETISHALCRVFAESVIFDREEIKYIKKAFSLDDFQAEAFHFANLLTLRDEYVKDCLKIFDKFITKTIEEAFNEINKKGILYALKEFRKASYKTKNTFVEGVGLPYVERLKQNIHLFIKTPNVGRPPNTSDKTGSITLAIKNSLEENFGVINESNIIDILDGNISASRITKTQVAAKLNISRPQLDKWLHNSKLDFEELVNQIQSDFYQKLKRQWRNHSRI